VDLSLIYEIQSGDTSDASIARSYSELIEQVRLADTLDFRTAWFVEHAFLSNFSLSSAPEVLIGYLAAVTERIRLGHGVVQLPFKINHPAKVAARIALQDLLSGGRMEFGGGRTTTFPEIVGYGLDPEATREQMHEHLRMLPEMWTQDEFSWSSDLFEMPERPIYPKPVQKPHPPMWVASQSPSSVEFAGDNGLGVLGFGIGIEGSNDMVRLYKERIKTCKPLGKFVNDRFAIMIAAMCADTDEEALAAQGEGIQFFKEGTSALYSAWITEGGQEVPESYRWWSEHAGLTDGRFNSITPEEIVATGNAVVGSPETCRKVLQSLVDAGVDEVLLIHQLYKTDHKKIMRSMELLSKVVLPQLEPAPAETLA
jgi:alkanesulfonate monooxygenase SsuD/methylene tetrahydromethanopterin reductase-like flavin-dependent oxidoreductase (luciferase family)